MWGGRGSGVRRRAARSSAGHASTAMIVKIQMTTTTTTTTTSDYFTVVLRACEGVTYLLSPFSTAVPIYLGTNHSNSK